MASSKSAPQYIPVKNPSYYDPSPNMAHNFKSSRSPSSHSEVESSPYSRGKNRYAGSYPSRSGCSFCDWILFIFVALLIAVAVYCQLHANSLLASASDCSPQCVSNCYSQYPRTFNDCDLNSCNAQCDPQASRAIAYKLTSLGTAVAGIISLSIVLCLRFCSGCYYSCCRDCCAVI